VRLCPLAAFDCNWLNSGGGSCPYFGGSNSISNLAMDPSNGMLYIVMYGYSVYKVSTVTGGTLQLRFNLMLYLFVRSKLNMQTNVLRRLALLHKLIWSPVATLLTWSPVFSTSFFACFGCVVFDMFSFVCPR
jgi:hypothetical protein